jgi:hypothetical protein
MKIQFSVQFFFKSLQIANYMKIHLLRVELFRAEGQTDRRMDRTKLIVTFRNFANALKTLASIPTIGSGFRIQVFEQYGEVLQFAQLSWPTPVNSNKHIDTSPYCNFLSPDVSSLFKCLRITKDQVLNNPVLQAYIISPHLQMFMPFINTKAFA